MRQLAALAAGLLGTVWASSACAVPVLIGENNDHTAASTTLAVTTTADCPVGAVLVGIGGTLLTSNSPTSVTDNLGTHNTYSIGNAQNFGNIVGAAFYSKITTDLPLGSVVTMTLLSSQYRWIVLYCTTDFTWAASPNDINPTSDGLGTTGSTATPSFTSAALAQASEQAFGFLMVDPTTSAATITEDGTWSHLTTYTAGATGYQVNIAYRNTAATTALTYAPSLSVSGDNWEDNIMSFKVSGGSGPKHLPSTLSLMGLGE